MGNKMEDDAPKRLDIFEKNERTFLRFAYFQSRCSRAFEAESAFRKVNHKIERKKRLRRCCRIAAAASCVLFVGLSLLLVREKQELNEEIATAIVRIPGIPVLTLGNGEEILLQNHLNEQLAQKERLISFDTMNQQIDYSQNQGIVSDRMEYNTLRVPAGGEFSLILSDGSKVILNAETELRYPVRFAANERRVELSGEAYFEVARDTTAPFIVQMDSCSIQVLGTSFNVTNYQDEKYWSTVLVSGKIEVQEKDHSQILKPSERYVVDNETGSRRLEAVYTDLYTSWIKGKIVFRDERLEDIVRKLQRWFDFQMFYANQELKDWRFGGVINGYDSFDTVLRYLERTADLHFDIDGKTVVVRKA